MLIPGCVARRDVAQLQVAVHLSFAVDKQNRSSCYISIHAFIDFNFPFLLFSFFVVVVVDCLFVFLLRFVLFCFVFFSMFLDFAFHCFHNKRETQQHVCCVVSFFFKSLYDMLHLLHQKKFCCESQKSNSSREKNASCVLHVTGHTELGCTCKIM